MTPSAQLDDDLSFFVTVAFPDTLHEDNGQTQLIIDENPAAGRQFYVGWVPAAFTAGYLMV